MKAKKQFINDVINDEIIIYKRKKKEIIQDLLKNNIVQVSSGKLVDNFSNDENTSNYDYLIKMSLYLFTEDEINKLEKEINKIDEEYLILSNKTIEKIWIEELNILLKNL